MTLDLDFTRQDFERALEDISFNPGIFDHVVQCSGCNTTIRGIVDLYCLREPRASENIAILRIHLPVQLSHPRILAIPWEVASTQSLPTLHQAVEVWINYACNSRFLFNRFDGFRNAFCLANRQAKVARDLNFVEDEYRL